MKNLYCDQNFIEFAHKGPIDNKQAFGLDNGLAPTRWEAIIWTNADAIHWPIYATLEGDEWMW